MAAVWRDPQLTLLISAASDTSTRAGNAWIEMNTSLVPSSSFPPPFSLSFSIQKHVYIKKRRVQPGRVREIERIKWVLSLSHRSFLVLSVSLLWGLSMAGQSAHSRSSPIHTDLLQLCTLIHLVNRHTFAPTVYCLLDYFITIYWIWIGAKSIIFGCYLLWFDT